MKRFIPVLVCAAVVAVFCGCNSEPVVFAEALQLKQGDRLQLGEVELMLIPCCDDVFKWETKK